MLILLSFLSIVAVILLVIGLSATLIAGSSTEYDISNEINRDIYRD